MYLRPLTFTMQRLFRLMMRYSCNYDLTVLIQKSIIFELYTWLYNSTYFIILMIKWNYMLVWLYCFAIKYFTITVFAK